ncbi:MAG TPA: radical SAM protein [Candidatus Omnitrophota bacterium]|mgnify:CR=1 FL=1|nr:radical SAM protein [Candidatus Omnitrophota bacterium]HPS37573.1 radical SAM protein [Candidatus Omnitrophota bacterium]
MKVYLIHPKFEPTIWSFEGLQPFTGTRFSTTPLGLATVAALTPVSWEVEIADENVEAINFETDADLIAIGVFNVQYRRALEIAAEFQKRGKKIAFGGPYNSLFPEAFEGKGDHRIVGEAEEIWPEFLNDFEAGKARECYTARKEKVDIRKSPVPRYDLIHGDRYNMFSLQTSRGCPFNCEFCDIIIMDGRVPRTKTVQQVIDEVDHCVKQGAHYIVFGDANFIGNLPFAREMLKGLAEYSKKNGYPIEFSCELTINVAHHPDILELLQAANFYSVFVGIESPRKTSLLESGKSQNTRENVLEDIKRIQSYHISVVAGMIVGFDSDDKQIFKEQYDFLEELGIPFTTCGTLMALPKTPLAKRLEAEGRLLDSEWTEMNGHGASDCNFVPKHMTVEEIRRGYNWLSRCLYRYDSYADRLVTALNRFQNRNKEHKRANLDFKFLGVLTKVILYYVFTFDKKRRDFFLKTFLRVATGGPFSVGKWLEFFRWIATHRAFRKYVTETQGDPEDMNPAEPPFPVDAAKEDPDSMPDKELVLNP